MKFKTRLAYVTTLAVMLTFGAQQILAAAPPDCGDNCPDPSVLANLVLWFLIHATPACAWWGFCG